MLHIKVQTFTEIKEEEITLRKVNELFIFLLSNRLKEIIIGQTIYKRAEIISLDLFKRDEKKQIDADETEST